MGIKADNVPSCPKYTLFAFNLIVLGQSLGGGMWRGGVTSSPYICWSPPEVHRGMEMRGGEGEGGGALNVPRRKKETFFEVLPAGFLIGGLIMTIVGIVALADDDYFAGREFLEPKMFRAGAILVITVGIFIIIFSFLGCCGAIKESSCLLMTYAVLTSLALIGVGTVAILGFVFKENVVELMDDKLRDFMNRYEPDNPNDPETYAWDKLQSICTPTNKNVYTAGCMAIVHKLEGYAGTLAIVALVFAILMVDQREFRKYLAWVANEQGRRKKPCFLCGRRGLRILGSPSPKRTKE
ncbi:unnamed protein product [Darwinula stevensoni]|uniref:Tetraspanin n=1 Tax=Darwinula stevensoni TaxID=69355 RepID=A0A7R8X686_9CRUS|nr:unnamed protein product [Darwinula stevensoni]CAG0881837.1 unnamed protein product [Darwinula stevensoni]